MYFQTLIMVPTVVLVLVSVLSAEATCSCDSQSSKNYVPLNCSSSCSLQGVNNSEGYCQSCFQQPPCKNVPYVYIPAEKVIPSSPFFIQLLSSTARTRTINNICYTYFLLDQTLAQYLLFISEVYEDYSNNVRICIVGPRSSGKVAFECYQGGAYGVVAEATVVGSDLVLGNVCNGNISAIYRCFDFMSCNSELSGLDYLYGGTSAMNVPLQCKLEIIDLLKDPKYNFIGRDFVILPNTKPFQCVTDFQGSKCIGYENIDSANSRNYP